VTYTVIARDMDTLAELGRDTQKGNGASDSLASVVALPGYAKTCVAIDVVVAEGSIVHDVAPNSRDLAQAPFQELCRDDGTTSEMTWN
jgi:hypothetical protein